MSTKLEDISPEPGYLVELINQLNGVEPTTPYSQVRQICRNAAQTLKVIYDGITDERQGVTSERSSEKR